MADDKRVLRYRGKPLEECSRDELIKAVHAAMDMLDREQRWRRTERSMVEVFRDAGLGDGR